MTATITEDEMIRKYIDILQLSDSVFEAATHYLEHPTEALTSDISLAVSTIFHNTKQLIEEEAGEYISASRHLADCLGDAGLPSEDLLTAVTAWRGALYCMVFEGMFERYLLAVPSILHDTAIDLFAIVDQAPLDNRSKSILWIQTALKSGYTAPEAAFQFLIKAFIYTADIGTFFEGIERPGYQFEPAKHPQRQFGSCPICGGSGVAHYAACSYTALDCPVPFYPAKLWMKCESCHNLYTRYYPEEYLSSAGQKLETITPHPSLEHVSRPQRQAIWGNILNSISEFTFGKDVLEVGIGKGEFIAAALEMGYHVDGIEIIRTTAQEIADLLDIPIICGNFLEFETDKKYSILSMGDVLEHLGDPVAALKKAYDLLRDDGILWLSTPNYESGFSRCMKYKDPMWLEPTHVTYFSANGLEQVAETCGFVIQKYSISDRYNGSMELILKKK